jgi:hypothetical protein
VYQDGIATKNFIPVTIANEYELTKVVNLSDAVRAEFAKTQPPKVPVAPVATPIPAPRPVAPVPKPIAQPRPIVSPKPAPVVEEPTLSFTEEAGNQKNAFEAISKMTDMKKLEHALKTDDRVGVQKALQKRIEELTE